MKEINGVRRGAWSAYEDELLRKCIAEHGEGKWHLIPLRAGLNRCRKSCRLRWLNYLRPNIKRGPFEVDEVDLIIRLHTLLGNRWSLIAGRLPGRTANDVKNFYNTHIYKFEQGKSTTNKATSSTPEIDAESKGKKPAASTVIKPRPARIFSSKPPSFSWDEKTIQVIDSQNIRSNNVENIDSIMDNHEPSQKNFGLSINNDWKSDQQSWPDNMLVDMAQVSDVQPMDIPEWIWNDDPTVFPKTNNKEVAGDESQSDDFGDLFIDMDIWNLLN